MKLLLSTLILVTVFSFNALGDFHTGHYYKYDGTKVTGWLWFNYHGNASMDKTNGNCTLSFKSSENGTERILTTNDVRCFVIGSDSFAIVKDFRLNFWIAYPQDFAQVIAAGKINLYLYYRSGSNGQNGSSYTRRYWIIEKNGVFDKLTKKKFKKLMPIYLSDFPGLLKQINDGDLKYRDTDKIIKIYNEEFR